MDAAEQDFADWVTRHQRAEFLGVLTGDPALAWWAATGDKALFERRGQIVEDLLTLIQGYGVYRYSDGRADERMDLDESENAESVALLERISAALRQALTPGGDRAGYRARAPCSN